MARRQVIHIASIAELRRQAVRWDDLWRRSNVALPTLRAEMIALWMEHFAPGAPFHAVAVEDAGRWVAALPLVGRPAAGFPAGWTVGNPWSTAADLLWDSSSLGDVETGAALVEAAGRLPWPLLWLEGIPLESPQWQALRAALRRAGTPTACRFAWNAGRIELDGDWPAQQRRWSRAHRRKMHSRMERLAARGDVTLDFLDRLPPQETSAPLHEAMRVEDAGWKGAGGTSILHAPEIHHFFLCHARLLALWNQLALAILRCGGRAIAFSYGMAAKGVFHSLKVGYDPEFAAYSPGQLLRCRLIERLCGDPAWRGLDFVGPMSEAQAHWRPRAYPVGRLMVAPRGWIPRLTLWAYRRWRPYVEGTADAAVVDGRVPIG